MEINIVFIALLALWEIPFKGVALWKSARLGHKKWFIVLLLVNSLAILPIYYIYFIAKKYKVESVEEKN